MKGKKINHITDSKRSQAKPKLWVCFFHPQTEFLLVSGPLQIKTLTQERIGVLSREMFCAKEIVFCLYLVLCLSFIFLFLKKSGPS